MKPSFDDVTIVSVIYKSAALLETLVATLGRFPHVIVIDNASGDDLPAALAARLPHAQIVCNTRNLGFGPANNQAVALVQTPFALLLNPDCDISVDALQTLLETAGQYPQAALIAPQGWYSERRVQPSYRQGFYERRTAQPYRIPDGTCSAKWLHGCCQLVRVKAFRAFGGFDERFFLYYEDDDLCLRALLAGYDCLLEPRAEVLHLGGASSTPSWRTDFFKHFHFFRSRHLIIGKYQGAALARNYWLRTVVAAPLAMLIYTLLLRKKHALKWFAWGYSAWTKPIFSVQFEKVPPHAESAQTPG
jgi:N-acetylglucosaminyl-diphospho-decaprenol L-rhamnosyltransferase